MTILNEELSAAPGKTYEYYIDQYKIKHKTGYGYGNAYQISPSYLNRDHIKTILANHNVDTLLDYGIAAGDQYKRGELHKHLGFESFTGYDPAFEEYMQRPEGKFDVVICYDVLEHIPEDSLDYVIQDIFYYCNQVAIFKMGLGPAVAMLPNGENAHITIKSLDWWKDKIRKHKPEHITAYVHHVAI